MTLDEVLDQIRELLQQRGRVTYRSLKLRYQLDDELLAVVTDELISAERVAVDEDGKVLVWIGTSLVSDSTFQVPRSTSEDQKPETRNEQPVSRPQPLETRFTDGERRQLTVMFCDLVGSTALSAQLDPEDLREVVRNYQQTCAAVIQRYEGHIAQYLGDGLLVYFGYPTAHEDDATRAVRAGLEIIEALRERGSGNEKQGERRSLQVRVGIHTGPVVVGEIGAGERTERLALGETPNIAARVQGLAEPDTVVLSAATHRLVAGLFECQDLGPQALKGLTTPVAVYQVLGESGAQSRFEAAVQKGLTPLVGREHEVGLLQERWEQAKQGAGQVVLLSGEPGIGKSRLVQTLKDHVTAEGAARIEFRCSAYHQNSALYPIIDHLQRLLQFAREDSPAAKLEKLQDTLGHYRFPQADTVPLLSALLSLPHPEGYPPITVSPQKQKEKTQAALVAWLVEEAEKAAVFCAWEDLHWVDPSTLEVLTLFLDQVPTTRLLALLTFRPEFTSPWGNRSHLSQMTLNRLSRTQVREMVSRVVEQAVRASTGSARTGNLFPSDSDSVRPELVEGRVALPADLIDAVVARTDGVPLFVEELTKTVVESIGEQEGQRATSASLTIPSTLQDSLMARLDRLGSTKEIAQLGATLGREFSYELLHAVSPVDERGLQQGLRQLVEVELLYQRGLPPQAHYLFKHALIQDTAYQSLLKSTRQQYHRQIAQVLADRFPETVETQPELVAQHYTEAGLIAQALPYWQRAGERANQRSAHVEAVAHITRALELLKTLPDTPERVQQELGLQAALGTTLMITKGYAAPEVERAHARALELCQQLGETPQLVPVLFRMSLFYMVRGEIRTALELAKQLLSLAQRVHPLAHPLLVAHLALGITLFPLGEFASALTHIEQSIALYDPQLHRPDRSQSSTTDPKVVCLSYAARVLWNLGYPDQARKRMNEALTVARELSHPFSLGFALANAAGLNKSLREVQAVQERTEARMTLAREHGFPFLLAGGAIQQGWVLAKQGQEEEGIAQMRQGLAAYWATGADAERPSYLADLAAAHGKVGHIEEGLMLLAEALTHVDKTGARENEAELYRLKGELTLQQSRASLGQVQDKSQASQNKSEVPNTQHPTPSTQAEAEAEAYFLKAVEVARHQQAKSLELRAATSLSRLWQQQGKKDEAHKLLADVYNWFTEGFDTKDLQEAKALLDELL